MLPDIRPNNEISKFWNDGNRFIGRRYRPNFIPKGFFPRLMFRLLIGISHCRTHILWKNGIILSTGIGTNQQLAHLEFNLKKIELDIYFKSFSKNNSLFILIIQVSKYGYNS